MILLIHDNDKSIKVLDGKLQDISINLAQSITQALFETAIAFPEELIIWCHNDYLDFIDITNVSKIFHHNSIMASYSISNGYFIPADLGYVDSSIFLNVKKDVCYPTWLMSSDVGGIHASVLILNADQINFDNAFDYFLNSLAKLMMPKGLFCYSQPNLIKAAFKATKKTKQASKYKLFKFVKQHYKRVWVFMLFLSYLIYEKKLMVLPLLKSIFYKKIHIDYKMTSIQSSKNLKVNEDIDVIIPTIGRKKYVYDVLKDLAKQTLLPKHVIIVEQNPDLESNTELDYLKNETWPFNIKHRFIHQTGACNARNLALSLVESEWVFLNDDDNRFDEFLLSRVFDKIKQFGINALITSYIQKNESPISIYSHQANLFGSGNSFINADILKKVSFNMALEFGYGEDFDFGVQLRNNGVDVIYFPDISITHLKAPMGGFRVKVKQLWDDEIVEPKPSPTIMYNQLQHSTEKQILGYKTLLFIKFFRNQANKNVFTYFIEMNKRWNKSVFWGNKLKNTFD